MGPVSRRSRGMPSPPDPFLFVEGAEVYDPEASGPHGGLVAGGKIASVGEVDASTLRAALPGCRVVDARDCLPAPGFVDPHEHLIGPGGEAGSCSRPPPLQAPDLALAGITTAVGCLGTDTATRHLTALLAKTRELRAAGLTAFMYTGGFPVPPPTITGSIADDL